MTQLYSLAEGLPASKRLKTAYIPDYNTFQPGSIIKCKLTNFMSYSLTEFHFGPRMNLIIGPNGSGKSTFVCAVCIGLGGKLANLGKESMTTDGFIKDNQDSAEIKLELKSFESEDSNSFFITTKLFRNHKTQWEINNRSATENDIKKLLKSYNIQLDNLCQFLPQDRVSKFADLKAEDLLKEIERSYKNGEMLEEHFNIIKLQTTINQEEKTFNESREVLLDLKLKNDNLREKVDKHRHYLKLKKNLEKTEMIRPYVILQDKKSEMLHLKELFEIEKQEFSQFQVKIKPIEDSLKSSDKELIQINELIKDIEAEKSKLSHESKTIDSKIEQLDKKNEQYLSNIRDYDDKILKAKEDYQKLKREYLKIENDLNKLDSPDEDDIKDWKKKRIELKNQFLEFDDQLTDLKSKINANSRKMDSIKNDIISQQEKLNSKDRINTIDPNKFKNSIKAVKILRKYKSQNPDFNIKYFEPALITLDVQTKLIAPIIETLIPYSHFNAIVVPTKEDYNELSKFLYDERKCMVSIRTLSDLNFNIENERIPRDKILKLGFDGYITDFLKGPKEIIQMLSENVYLNRIPVSFKGLSTNQKDLITKEIQNGLKLVKYVSHDEIYTMNKSLFGKKQITTNIRLFKLTSTIIQNGLSEEQKKNINERINELNKEYKNIEINIKDFKNLYNEKKDNYNNKQIEFDKFEENIKRAGAIKREESKLKQRLEMTKERASAKKKVYKSLKINNNETNKNKIYSKINFNLDEKLKLQRINKKGNLIKSIKNDSKLIELNIQKSEETNKLESVKLLNNSIQDEKKEKTSNLENIKISYKKSKKFYQDYLNEYKIKVNEYSIKDKEDMKNLIEEMANKGILNQEGLNVKIDKLKSEMELNNKSGGEVSLQQLESNEIKIKELNEKIPLIEESIKNNKNELNKILSKWENELNKIIEIINKDFSDNMNKIASGGNVKLDKSDEDFNKWKLIIQVSFRDNEELSNFNGSQHSGGEKSTTTAIFLNSLQGLTNTPFRVVDEINQGMDSKNERKAHELIVKKATNDDINASQYFLITPKLLTDLYYGPSMTVHCIFAGRWCPGCSDDLPYLEMGICSKYVESG